MLTLWQAWKRLQYQPQTTKRHTKSTTGQAVGEKINITNTKNDKLSQSLFTASKNKLDSRKLNQHSLTLNASTILLFYLPG